MTFLNINRKAWLTKERRENEAMLPQLFVIPVVPGGIKVKQKSNDASFLTCHWAEGTEDCNFPPSHWI